MQRIVPHLWFDKEAVEAAEFYTRVFDDTRITHRSVIRDTPSGDCDVAGFNIMGFQFMAISAGPHVLKNPAISFFVNFDPSQDKEARTKIDTIWEKLVDGGKALMPLDKYPFSERYGWVEDRYGVSWQLIYTNPEGEERPVVIPSLLFAGASYGKAEEAVDFYLSVFKSSKMGNLMRYGPGQEPNREGTVMFSDFTLEGTWFAAMDGGGEHDFNFNEGISLIVNCKGQDEIDYFWKKLSAVPEAERCGWLKDKFGVSWQITPENMDELMARNPEKTTPAMLGMKKIVIRELEDAAG
ncbi:MAG: VOC family protein [Spirochaetales bacterium]|nr:VOC family protein [Spirochaetales bacterium]